MRIIPPGKTVIPRHECMADILCPPCSLNETKTPIFLSCNVWYWLLYAFLGGMLDPKGIWYLFSAWFSFCTKPVQIFLPDVLKSVEYYHFSPWCGAYVHNFEKVFLGHRELRILWYAALWMLGQQLRLEKERFPIHKLNLSKVCLTSNAWFRSSAANCVQLVPGRHRFESLRNLNSFKFLWSKNRTSPAKIRWSLYLI